MTTVSQFLKNNGLLYDKYTKVADTHDFFNKVVQMDDDPNNVASAEATLLFSGPPVFGKVPGGGAGAPNAAALATFASFLVPIGAVQGFQESETPNMTPFPEIGSRLKRYAIGMSNTQVSMSKVLTYHSNLRHALYAWIANLPAANAVDSFILKPGQGRGNEVGANQVAGATHFTTLESDLFRVPFGLMLATVSAGGVVICKEYYEKCYVANAGKAVQAGQAMIMENVALTVTRKIPADGITLTMANAAGTPNFTIRKGNDTVQGVNG